MTTNDYYNATTSITEDSKARSTTLNAIFQAIKAGFDLLPGKDKLNQNRVAYAVDAGAADAYTITMTPTLTAYTDGLKVRVKIANTNTGAATINIDSIGARSIKRQDGTDPDAGDLTAGDLHDLIYDGTNFVLATPSRAHMAGIANNLAADLTFSGNNTFTGSNTHTGAETFDDDAFTLRDNADSTKTATFQLSGITTATARAFTFPDASGTLVLVDAAQTLTNKTLTSPDINGGTVDGANIGTTTPGTGAFTTLTASGTVNIDSGTFYVDVTNNMVGVGTTSPSESLHVVGSVLATQHYRAGGVSATGGGASGELYGFAGKVSLVPTNQSGGFDFTSEFYFDAAGTAKWTCKTAMAVQEDFSVAGVVEITESANGQALSTKNTHASFTGTSFNAETTRTASSAFNFCQMVANADATPDIVFKFRGDGEGTCDGSWTGGGADYAEYFEWADGNPGGEDRRGLSVVLEGDKIRPALDGEDPIGAVSANPSVVGDGDIDRWKGKYLRDDFGAYFWEDYETVEWTEIATETVTEQVLATEDVERAIIEIEDGVAIKRIKTVAVPVFDEYPLRDEAGNDLGTHKVPRMVDVERETTKEVKHSYAADQVPEGLTVPADATRTTQQRRTLNSAFDPTLEYVPRAERPEWAVIGLVGKLRLRKGQTVGTNWIKMRDVSTEVEEWLVR